MSFEDANQGEYDDFDQVESALSESDSGGSLREVYSDMDAIEKMGAFMGGVAGPSVMLAPSESSEIKDMLPEEVSVAGADVNVDNLVDQVYQFKDEWIIGDRNEWFVGTEREADNLLQATTLTADKWGHYTVGYLGGRMGAGLADNIRDRYDMFSDEYDPKVAVLGGGLALGAFMIGKEGLIEGGSGVQFDPDNVDVIGDWAMDTAGAAHSVYNYHKRKTVEEGEDPTGLVGEIANKAGRTYEKAVNSFRNSDHAVNNSVSEDDILEVESGQTEFEENYDGLVERGIIDSSNVQDRGELQEVIGEVSELYDSGSKSAEDLEAAAEKLIQDYGRTVRSEAINKGYDLGADRIVEQKLDEQSLDSSTAEEALTAAVNRYKIDYDETQDAFKTGANPKNTVEV